jgi:hypothetical protein
VVSEEPDLDRVPPELRPLIERCLAKAPGDRPGLGELLSELGGGLIGENWLPETVAGTLPRYEPSARIAALASGEAPPTAAPALRTPTRGIPAPGTPEREATDRGRQARGTLAPETPAPQAQAPEALAPETLAPEAPAGAGITQAVQTAPAGGRHRMPGQPSLAGQPTRPGRRGLPALLRRPWLRRHGRAVTAVVAVMIAAILATWLTLGTDILGRHPGGPAQSLVGAGASATPTSATRTGGTIAARSGHGSPKASVTPHRPTSAVSRTPATTIRPTRQPSPSSAATTPAAAPTPTPPASTPATHQSSPASSPPAASSAGALSATNGTTYSCSDHPIAGASSTSASYEWVNNTSNTVYVYYTDSSFYSGYTGSVPANSSVGSTIAVGGTYLVESPMGTCLGAVKINATTGTVTIS